MAFADSSNAQLSIVEESTFGTTPATPTWQTLRITGESLNENFDNTTSNEIRSDAEVSDLIQTGNNVGGDVQFELSKGEDFDLILEHALRNSYSTNDLIGGTDFKSLSIEKMLETGTTDQYFRYQGCRVSQLQLTVQAGSILTGSASFMGLEGDTGTAEISGATYDDPNSNDVMTAVDVGSITVGGVSATLYYTDMSFTLNNNCRYQNAVGNLGAVGIGYGRREVTGSLTAYFENQDLYEEFRAGNASSISFVCTDGSNSYTITFPKVKYSSGSVTAGGNNQDIFAQMSWQALYDSGEGSSIKIVKSA